MSASFAAKVTSGTSGTKFWGFNVSPTQFWSKGLQRRSGQFLNFFVLQGYDEDAPAILDVHNISRVHRS